MVINYWVSAYATPMQRNGETVEPQSVCTRPPKALVEAAEHLYAQLRSGKKTHCLSPSRLSVGMRYEFAGTALNLLGFIVLGCGRPILEPCSYRSYAIELADRRHAAL